METNYRGFVISQPAIFNRKAGAKGNGLTSIKVVSDGISGTLTLKTFSYKRHDNKDLAKAVQKAKDFIDDMLLEGKPVEITEGKYAGVMGLIECVTRRQMQKKPVIFYTVALDGENTPPFEAFGVNQLKFL